MLYNAGIINYNICLEMLSVKQYFKKLSNDTEEIFKNMKNMKQFVTRSYIQWEE